jgi:hypothetical protein
MAEGTEEQAKIAEASQTNPQNPNKVIAEQEKKEEPETPEVSALTNVDVGKVLGKAGDETLNAAARSKIEEDHGEGWKLGLPAPATKYLDKDGQTVLDEPSFTKGVGSRLVEKGETITRVVLDRLALGKKK